MFLRGLDCFDHVNPFFSTSFPTVAAVLLHLHELVFFKFGGYFCLNPEVLQKTEQDKLEGLTQHVQVLTGGHPALKSLVNGKHETVVLI